MGLPLNTGHSIGHHIALVAGWRLTTGQPLQLVSYRVKDELIRRDSVQGSNSIQTSYSTVSDEFAEQWTPFCHPATVINHCALVMFIMHLLSPL